VGRGEAALEDSRVACAPVGRDENEATIGDLELTEDRDIRTDVRGDLHVHPGVRVRIQGSFEGSITVDYDGYLVLAGTCGGRIVHNQGSIVLAGTVKMPLGGDSGNVRVVVGSVIVDHRTGRASRLGLMGVTPLRDPDAVPELDRSGQMCMYNRFSGEFDLIGFEE
jgi:hypothetical protein